jgi:hypothetical protein
MRTLHSVLFAVAVSGLAACTGSAQVHTTAEADYVQPQLVEVEPGVQVVADYDQPVFFSGGAYWRNDGGVWYRSRYHDREWVRAEAPVAVVHIQHPEVYVHYHGKVQADERHEARDEHKEMHDQNEVRHDEHEQNHDANEIAHDRAEVRHDEVKGNEHAEAHDAKELRHDEKEQNRDAKEMNKDERKEAKDAHKVDKDERKREKDERKH